MPVHRFGPFALDTDAFRLSRDGRELSLQPKQLQLLALVVAARGAMVPREVVQSALWPDVVVAEGSLRQVVHRLRDALGPEHEAWIETLPRVGFRFAGPVDAEVEVLWRIGGGGMGEVLAVRRHGRERALKVLAVKSSELGRRLQREGAAQASVQHPNVLEVLEVLEHEGSPALVLPLVPGPSLREVLAQRALSEREAHVVFSGVARGLEAIGAAGLVHRDLKPGNVLLDPVSDTCVVPRLADFGLVKVLADSGITAGQVALGTPEWMAPEQRRDAASVDVRADRWSLGRLLRALHRERPPPPWDARAEALMADDPSQRPSPDGWEEPESLEVPELVSLCRALAPRASPAVERSSSGWPAERDAFVGRAAELAALADAAGRSRLVTVTGPGGVGKTRLVLQWLRARGSPDDVFCDLSEAADLETALLGVALALGVPLARDPVSQLAQVFAARGAAVVVLDNLEQVLGPASDALSTWLDRAPRCRFVVTSRERTGLPGEQVLGVEPLAPTDAEALFALRAAAVRADFAEDPGAVRALVQLLDGLPLAVELAAARTSAMSVDQVLARMSDRFAVLAVAKGRGERHSALRATLRWSWELLSGDEQLGLSHLSVFDGGFTLDAAEAVLPPRSTWAVDLIQSLVDKSLVRRARRDRYELLASVAAFAREQLADPGDAERRHGRWFARFGTVEALSALHVSGGPERRRALSADLDNLIAASRRASSRGDGAVAGPTARAAFAVLHQHGLDLGAALLEAVPPEGLDPLTAARVRLDLGIARMEAGRVAEADAHVDAVLAAATTLGDPTFEVGARVISGARHVHAGRLPLAIAELERALAEARAIGDERYAGRAIGNLAAIAWQQGRMDDAHRGFTEAATSARATGDRRVEGSWLGMLGGLALDGFGGDPRALIEQAIQIHREVGNARAELQASVTLANLDRVRGQVEAARERMEDVRARALRLGDRRFAAIAAMSACDGAADPRAAHERAAAELRVVGDPRLLAHADSVRARIELRAGDPAAARAWYDAALEGARTTGDRRLEGAVRARLADLDREAGDLDAAERGLTAADTLLRATSSRVERVEWCAIAAAVAVARGEPERAAEHRAEGLVLVDALGASREAELARRL